MKKRVLPLIAMLCAAVMLITGCNLIVMDEEMDRAEVVAKVGGEVVTKGEVLSMYEYYKGSYGITDDNEKTSAKETSEQVKAMIIDELVNQLVRKIKAREAGYLNFTDENRQEAEDTIAQQNQNYYDYYLELLGADQEQEAREMADNTLELTLQTMNLTYEQYLEQLMTDSAIERYMVDQTKDVAATQDQVREKQQALVESQKATFEEDVTNYDTLLSNYYSQDNGEPVVYRPAGYVRVKHILIALPTDIQDEISALREESLASGGEQPSTDEEKAAAKQADELRDAELAKVRDKAEEVLARVKAGEDFDALIEEFGEDPGMQTEPYIENGYELGINSAFDYTFKEASLALRNVDDTTELVGTDFGYHIIKLLEKMPEGELSFEQVMPKVQQYLDYQQQYEKRTELMTQWKEELKPETYYNVAY